MNCKGWDKVDWPNNVLSKIDNFERTLGQLIITIKIQKNVKNEYFLKERDLKEKSEFQKNVIRSIDLVPKYKRKKNTYDILPSVGKLFLDCFSCWMLLMNLSLSFFLLKAIYSRNYFFTASFSPFKLNFFFIILV